MTADNSAFIYGPSAEHPGWHTWDMADPERFNSVTMGRLLVRREELPGGGPAVRLRMFPERRHSNLLDAVHGAITLALIDISLFACMRHVLDGDAAGSVTLDLSTQFIGAGRVGQPLDAVVEALRETRRLLFLRGTVVQEDHLVAAFNGTVRKPSSR
ncbi:PaaI family thioesterase [Novosphingobium sp. AAP93]|uniref:PaaI family thioesterase n=1 Tax=Novosphingobium sp. AAP93 TaxID=1523427 RepID=UPI0006B8A24A|nr:PaaI family thioesterase [Novosphingobium sp. AAP93]KPF89119.1 thioesterase [Novosphingobium sp. AAP93]